MAQESLAFEAGHPAKHCEKCGSFGHVFYLMRGSTFLRDNLCSQCILVEARKYAPELSGGDEHSIPPQPGPEEV